MKCIKCKVKMVEKSGIDPNGLDYNFFRCNSCGEEILTMNQLHELAIKYRKIRKHTAKISKWGASIAIRIPKDLVKQFKLKENETVSLIPEKNSIKIVAD